MNSRKHIYYITIGDVQNIAQDTLGRKLREKELNTVIEKLLRGSKINWYDPIGELINEVVDGSRSN